MLLEIVANADAETLIRHESVTTLPRDDKQRKLYDVLKRLGPEGRFAMPAIIAHLDYDLQINRQSPGASYTAVKAVEWLQFWGTDAAEAVPVLTAIVQEHPNNSYFAPAAAETLGNIGPPSESAIPALVVATSRPYSTLATMAKEAIGKAPFTFAPPRKLIRFARYSKFLFQQNRLCVLDRPTPRAEADQAYFEKGAKERKAIFLMPRIAVVNHLGLGDTTASQIVGTARRKHYSVVWLALLTGWSQMKVDAPAANFERWRITPYALMCKTLG